MFFLIFFGDRTYKLVCNHKRDIVIIRDPTGETLFYCLNEDSICFVERKFSSIEALIPNLFIEVKIKDLTDYEWVNVRNSAFYITLFKHIQHLTSRLERLENQQNSRLQHLENVLNNHLLYTLRKWRQEYRRKL